MNGKILMNKNIIVTGTAGGIGREMVRIFSENGANVFAVARKETEEHKAYCEEISRLYNTKILPIYFDLTNLNEMKNAVQTIRSKKMAIDGLVNNAGITYNALFQMTSTEELRNQFEVNFFAPYIFTQYISKLMIRNGKGSIVSISSTAALDANSGRSAYGASKAALLTMTLCLARELAEKGIRANVICPGVTQTNMVSTMPEYIVQNQEKATFLKKLGMPSDIANTAMFLLSELSSYVTGQIIRVDGGLAEYHKEQ